MTVSLLIFEKGGNDLKQLLFPLSEKFPKNKILRLNSLHREVWNTLKEDILYKYKARKHF